MFILSLKIGEYDRTQKKLMKEDIRIFGYIISIMSGKSKTQALEDDQNEDSLHAMK